MKLDLVGWAERFVATPSVSRDGNLAISELAAELLRKVGLEPRFQAAELDGVEQRNVIADVGPEEDEEGLLLLTHLDTVPPGDPARWTATGGDPFRPTRAGDRLYGLGSADAKVDFLCKAAALGGIEPRRLQRRLRIVGTFGEEVGLLGTRLLVETGETRGFRYALVGEPSELWAIHAHKGYAVFEALLPRAAAAPPTEGRGLAQVSESFAGTAAHSSTPGLGQNAIEAALERIAAREAEEVVAVADLEGGGAVNQVPDACRLEAWVQRSGGGAAAGLAYPAEPLVRFYSAWRELISALEKPRDERFDPDHSVASLGRVGFSDGRPVFHFDLRPIPGVDPAEALEPLREVADISCLRHNPPLWTSLDSPLVAAISRAQTELGLDSRVGTKATCTEAGLLSEAGLEAAVMGPGLSVGNVHRPNEYTSLSQLARARDLYARVIPSLCCEEAA